MDVWGGSYSFSSYNWEGHKFLFEKTGRAGNLFVNYKKMYPPPPPHLALNDPVLNYHQIPSLSVLLIADHLKY